MNSVLTTTHPRQHWQLYARPALAAPDAPWRAIPRAVAAVAAGPWDLGALPALADELGWFSAHGTHYAEPVMSTTDLDIITTPALVVTSALGRILRPATSIDAASPYASVYTLTRSVSYSRTSAIPVPAHLRRLGGGMVLRWARANAAAPYHGGDE